MLSKAAQRGVGAFVASADVEGAIDGIRHHDVTEALLQKGMHPEAVCALMRESIDLDGGAPMAPEFSHARGTRQESVEGPDMWNQVLDSALRKPAARWEAEGIDFDLRLTIAEQRRDGRALLGMIEFFIICAGPMTCVHWLSQSRILKDTTDSIEKLGMQWKEKSLAMVAGPYTSCKAGDEIEITSSNEKKWKWRVVDGMEALGTWSDVRGCSEASPWYRIAKANSLFTAKKRLLCDPKIPVKRRIHAFLSTCVAAALHGAGEWATHSPCFRHYEFGNWASSDVSYAYAERQPRLGWIT